MENEIIIPAKATLDISELLSGISEAKKAILGNLGDAISTVGSHATTPAPGAPYSPESPGARPTAVQSSLSAVAGQFSAIAYPIASGASSTFSLAPPPPIPPGDPRHPSAASASPWGVGTSGGNIVINTSHLVVNSPNIAGAHSPFPSVTGGSSSPAVGGGPGGVGVQSAGAAAPGGGAGGATIPVAPTPIGAGNVLPVHPPEPEGQKGANSFLSLLAHGINSPGSLIPQLFSGASQMSPGVGANLLTGGSALYGAGMLLSSAYFAQTRPTYDLQTTILGERKSGGLNVSVI